MDDLLCMGASMLELEENVLVVSCTVAMITRSSKVSDTMVVLGTVQE